MNKLGVNKIPSKHMILYKNNIVKWIDSIEI